MCGRDTCGQVAGYKAVEVYTASYMVCQFHFLDSIFLNHKIYIYTIVYKIATKQLAIYIAQLHSLVTSISSKKGGQGAKVPSFEESSIEFNLLPQKILSQLISLPELTIYLPPPLLTNQLAMPYLQLHAQVACGQIMTSYIATT